MHLSLPQNLAVPEKEVPWYTMTGSRFFPTLLEIPCVTLEKLLLVISICHP